MFKVSTQQNEEANVFSLLLTLSLKNQGLLDPPFAIAYFIYWFLNFGAIVIDMIRLSICLAC